jgi:hypothetical protein
MLPSTVARTPAGVLARPLQERLHRSAALHPDEIVHLMHDLAAHRFLPKTSPAIAIATMSTGAIAKSV